MAKKFEPKKDCFGLYAGGYGGTCSILKETLCVTRGACPFYASGEEAAEKSKLCRLRAMQKGYYLGSGKYEPRGNL